MKNLNLDMKKEEENIKAIKPTKHHGRPKGVKGNPKFKQALKPALYEKKEEAVFLLTHAQSPEAQEIAKKYVNALVDLIFICTERRMF